MIALYAAFMRDAVGGGAILLVGYFVTGTGLLLTLGALFRRREQPQRASGSRRPVTGPPRDRADHGLPDDGCGKIIRVSSYPGRWLVIAGYVGWAVCVTYVIACLISPHVFGTAGCELAPGSSVFGSATPSWLPPGTTCTYDLSPYGLSANVVTRPSELRLVVVAVALVGLPLVAHLRRLLTRPVPVDAWTSRRRRPNARPYHRSA